jgi:cyclopropane fatty-acyl-phospholipid synthase-like methyltransferase
MGQRSVSAAEHPSGKVLASRIYPRFFPLDPQDRVINLGCGDGPQAVVYADQAREMVGVDINPDRVRRSEDAARAAGAVGYRAICANVEETGLPAGSFEKAIVIDVIEHVEHPDRLLAEVRRLLVPGGRVLITFPALHDRYVDAGSWLKRTLLRRPARPHPEEWHPDLHNQDRPLSAWLRLCAEAGFTLERSRASTLFPPLHLYGVPRFWFSNPLVRRVDGFLASLPFLRRWGQSLVCVLRAPR